MNIQELRDAVETAMNRGLHPETTVVVADGNGWYSVLEEIEDPSEPGRHGTDRQLMWFTLYQGEDADSRFTAGHEITPSPPVWAQYEDHVRVQAEDGGSAMDYVDWVKAQIGIEDELTQDIASDDYEGRAAQYQWLSALAHEAERYA